MNQPDNIAEYKQEVIKFYAARNSYDNDFTIRRAMPMIEVAQLKPGMKVLDVATGTGIVAIEAAKIVGSQGKVLGIDLTSEMLAQAEFKIAAEGLNNIDLIHADIEDLDFKEESFDAILCSYAIVLLTDIPQALTNWYRFLKPGGVVVFNCFPQTAFFEPVIRKVCAQVYNIDLPSLNTLLGTPEKCYTIMEQAEFQGVEIRTEQFGSHQTLEEAQKFWNGFWLHVNNPLLNLSDEQKATLTSAFKKELETLVTENGVWYDFTTFFVRGCK